MEQWDHACYSSSFASTDRKAVLPLSVNVDVGVGVGVGEGVNGVLSVLLQEDGGGFLRNRADSSAVLALDHGMNGSGAVVSVHPSLGRTRAPQTRILCTRDATATARSCSPTAGNDGYQRLAA